MYARVYRGSFPLKYDRETGKPKGGELESEKEIDREREEERALKDKKKKLLSYYLEMVLLRKFGELLLLA